MVTQVFSNKSFGGLDFTSIVGNETDIGAVLPFVGNIGEPVAGYVPNDLSGYIGLTWGGLLAGVYGPSSMEAITFTFDVAATTPGTMINGAQAGFTLDYLEGTGVSFTGVAQMYSGGLLVGQISINQDNPLNPSLPAYVGSGDFAMYGGFTSLSVVYTLTAKQSEFSSVDAALLYSAVEVGFAQIDQAQLAGFGDKVFDDANANGVQDSGETGVAGVTVKLLDADGNFLGATTTTDASGSYAFTNLNAGVYRAEFVKPSTAAFTTADAGGNDAADSDANSLTGVTGEITLVAGQTDGTIDAGLTFVLPTTITAVVFYDQNGNGVQEPGDVGASGITVQLLNGSGQVIATTTTDANGTYTFTAVPGGAYQVSIVPPGGTTISTQTGGPNNNGDGGPGSTNYVNPNTGASTQLNLIGGQPGATVVAGLYVPASLSGRAFIDANANGVQESDVGLSGITVNLLANIGPFGTTVVSTVTTAADGTYSFTGLPPGSYSVQFVDAQGRPLSPTGQGTATTNSDADTGTGGTPTVVLLSGGNEENIDAGFWAPATLGGRAFGDMNANGVQEGGDNGLSGITVNLLNPLTNAVISTTTTDANGNYLFTNLTPGSYAVQFVNASGQIFSPTGQGTTTTDSDANTSTGTTGTVTLASGDDNRTLDAGLWQKASLGDTVFVDANSNGIQDVGEAGLSGVTVRLLDSTGTTTLATTTTGLGGAYAFTNLNAGTYTVQFVAPTTYQFTLSNVGGNDGADSDADVTTGKTSQITLSSGQNDSTIDAGVKVIPATGSIGDFVFLDRNGNGVQDTGEGGISCVTVQLLSSSGTVLATTVTDAGGRYSFGNLNAGVYSVKFVTPSGYTLSGQDLGGDDGKDSDASTATGITRQVTLAAGQTDLTLDAGMFQKACIGNRVFHDGNANGIQDSGECGISCVTVQLLSTSGAVLATTTTDWNGYYNFGGLNPGVYAVKFFTPNGYAFSTANQGSNDAADSDANASTGITGHYTLTSGQCDTSVDAGMLPQCTASVGNFVFEDKDKDGRQDVGETGLSGVTVKLLNSSGTVISTTTTNSGGSYLFSGLGAGTYSVQFMLKSGYNFTAADVGTNGAIDSDANTTTGKTANFTLSAGQSLTSIDAGMWKQSWVCGNDGLSIGYWKQHQSRWDAAGNDCNGTDILYRLSNHGYMGPNGRLGILLGDINGNGRVDTGETTLFVSLNAAQQLINPSVATGSDARLILMRQLIGAQLNVYNGADAAGWKAGTAVAGTDLISEAVKWVRGIGPFVGYSGGSSGNVDKTGASGVLDSGSSGSIDYNTWTAKFTSSAVSTTSAAWSTRVSIGVGDIKVSGLDLKNALESFNSDGNGLVVSGDGQLTAWGNNSSYCGSCGNVTNITSNDATGLWSLLKSQGMAG